ncbi:hypothetical protein VE03_00718 [Pseudogymnoascus sp. 23342-1-I1]|nr:hypothetical protein VE03_00718 [Pseudogymnoascus sp. 23342-1-I1]
MDQCESVLQMIQSQSQSPPGELPTRPAGVKRSRSPAPERDCSSRNLRPRRNQPSYIESDPEDYDFDSDPPEDSPLTAAQPIENTINQPTITSDVGSPNIGPTPASQTNENTSIEQFIPPSPPPTPDAPLMAPQTKTETGEPDIDSEAEDERELVSVAAKILSDEAKINSDKAKVAFLKTRKANREARKMATLLAVSMADAKKREDELTAALVGADRVLDDQLNELYGVKERYDDWMVELSMKMKECAGMAERRERLGEFINLIEAKAASKAEKCSWWRKGRKTVTENDKDDGEVDKTSVAGDDKDDGEVDKISTAEDDESSDEDGDKGQRMSSTKDDGDGGDDDEYYEGDDDELDDFVVEDNDDLNYDDSDEDYRGDSDGEIFG